MESLYLSQLVQTIVLDESLMDAVTALSGSGPAYIFKMAEAMIKAGLEIGFNER